MEKVKLMNMCKIINPKNGMILVQEMIKSWEGIAFPGGKIEVGEIIVDSVKYETEGNYNFLRIELDKVNGIDLDTIVAATEVINPIIDELDLIDDSYILDIVSKEKGEE